ncbi:hypothetical protein J3459_010259 [Metarhizium acridum]|nr:hypothetical protein J3459_010259 [Metarhizium acridum]
MLYIKESIDVAAKQARIDAKARRAKEKAAEKEAITESKSKTRKRAKAEAAAAATTMTTTDEETVKVRSLHDISRPTFSLPIGKGAFEGLAEAMRGDHSHQHQNSPDLKPAHKHSTIQADAAKAKHDSYCRHYRITSISFVGHSLGGLIQTYAIAYIQKHSPDFFNLIQPINFISLASPFLGLSNENPLYVKFALDFGLVGRTGQDLGLTWRAPTIARSGWGALVSNLGESAHKKVYGESQAESKPLLRILPTGPAHAALKSSETELSIPMLSMMASCPFAPVVCYFWIGKVSVVSKRLGETPAW